MQRFIKIHKDLSELAKDARRGNKLAGLTYFLRNSLLNVVAKPALNKILWQIEVSLQERSKARRKSLMRRHEGVELTAYLAYRYLV